MSTPRSGAAFHVGKSRQNYSTPDDFMTAVVGRFGPIQWDLAAEYDNCKADMSISCYTIENNSLVRQWNLKEGWLWLNPPFGNITPWAKKCAEEAALGASILFLTPASVGSEWFRLHVAGKAHVLFLSPRLSFDGRHPYPKDCILSVYANGLTGYQCWKWK